MAGLLCAGAEAEAEFTRDHLMDVINEAGAEMVREGGVHGVFNALEGRHLFFGYNNIRWVIHDLIIRKGMTQTILQYRSPPLHHQRDAKPGHGVFSA